VLPMVTFIAHIGNTFKKWAGKSSRLIPIPIPYGLLDLWTYGALAAPWLSGLVFENALLVG
jgi:hypothetical protein